jgi:predicted RNA-binding Zn ribbon-like protein
MASVEVDGVRLPQRVADHPALDFCNTVAGWGQADAFEYLDDYEVLARLVGHLGLADRATVEALVVRGRAAPAAAAQVLRRTRELRAATYAVVTGEGETADRETVANAVRAAVAASRLVPGETSLAGWQPDPDRAGLATPLHLLALQVSDVLTARPATAVGRCPGHDCGWLFVNRGNRRWCDMATCGNRAKVRRHAARRSAAVRPHQ